MNLLLFIILGISSFAQSELRLAVASNFMKPMKAIKSAWEKSSEIKLTLIFGSSGKLYSQIIHGAPYDIFFSADQEKIDALVTTKIGYPKSRFTYAQGRLALWSATQTGISSETLNSSDIRKIAIANPKLAPYGVAAVEALKNLGLWNQLKSKLVYGESISQAYQFVYTKNADLGLLAYSQLATRNKEIWLLPQSLYEPVLQDAMIIKDSQASRNLIEFIQSEDILRLIESHGYLIKTKGI